MRLASLLLCAVSAVAQTSTYTYGTGCGGGGCTVRYYQSATNRATDPVYVYVSGGGGTFIATKCPPNGTNPEICAEITKAVQHGYQVYAPEYTLSTTTLYPEQPKQFACFLSDARVNNRPGNWQNITVAEESFGTVVVNAVFGGPVGHYLTDGLSNCPSSNTDWKIVQRRITAGVVDFIDSTNGYCVLNGGSKNGNCITWFGGSGGTLAQHQDASMSYWIANGTWAAKGRPRIIHVAGTDDSTVPIANATALSDAVAASGYAGPAYIKIVATGYGHPVDTGSIYAADSYPADLTNLTKMKTSSCNNQSPTFPSGYPICSILGYVGRAWDLFLPRAARASGGSGISGGSW